MFYVVQFVVRCLKFGMGAVLRLFFAILPFSSQRVANSVFPKRWEASGNYTFNLYVVLISTNPAYSTLPRRGNAFSFNVPLFYFQFRLRLLVVNGGCAMLDSFSYFCSSLVELQMLRTSLKADLPHVMELQSLVLFEFLSRNVNYS